MEIKKIILESTKHKIINEPSNKEFYTLFLL